MLNETTTRVTTEPGYDLAAWRAQIPILGSFIPMNNCSQAPLTVPTRAALAAYQASWNCDGMDWDRWMEEVEAARAAFARLINAGPDEVAVSTSVSAATASLASGLDFTGARRTVVVTEAEFPTVGHVWLAHRKYGADVAWVPVRDGLVYAEDYGPVLDDATLVVSATHAYYQNGFKQDLPALAERAHAHGALLYVDAYQSIGTCPIDVKAMGIDALSAGAHKYLMGMPGIAFLYVSEGLHERLHPALTGWFGRENPFAFDVRTLDWSPTARRFDTGTPPVASAYVARAGLEIIDAVGPARIHAWTAALTQRLIEGGRARGLDLHGTTDYRRKTPSTAFLVPGDSHAIEAALRRRGILASARGPAVRLAPHFYSTFGDVDQALDALAAEVRRAAP
jgi:selenocysteine lyase/cysteine desulfurase